MRKSPYFFCIFFFWASQCSAVNLAATKINTQISVVDDTGYKVILSSQATRIVALAPHIVENLFTVGAGELVIGAVSYSDYPEAAKRIERVGVASGISIEKIISLKPDLVITWHTGRSTALTKKLRSLGISVYADDPKKLGDISKSLRNFGVLTGHQTVGDSVAKKFDAQISVLREEFAKKDQLSVFYQVWHQPLQTLNGQHVISDIIQLCGGRNIFDTAMSVAPKVSIESVIFESPDVIVMSSSEAGNTNHVRWWQSFPMISAVKNQHFGFIEPDYISRHSVRIAVGAHAMCEIIERARKP